MGGRGKQRSGPIGAWAKIGRHQDWRSHPNPPFCIQTNCYFHIACYTQQFANPMQNITAFQSHGCTFYHKWPDGSQLSARVFTLYETKLWHCKTTPIWVVWPDWLPTCVSAWWLWRIWIARTAGLVASTETFGALLGVFRDGGDQLVVCLVPCKVPMPPDGLFPGDVCWPHKVQFPEVSGQV